MGRTAVDPETIGSWRGRAPLAPRSPADGTPKKSPPGFIRGGLGSAVRVYTNRQAGPKISAPW
jgi:hypothetical protein